MTALLPTASELAQTADWLLEVALVGGALLLVYAACDRIHGWLARWVR